MKSTIQINGRTYEVTREQDSYVLKGKRGAEYRTWRNHQGDMFLVACSTTRPKINNHVLAGAWLRDKNGTLEVI